MFGKTEIYNPWSILSYIDEAQGEGGFTPAARPYWSNTSSNSIVKELIYEADNKTRNDLEILMSGEEDNIDRMILACHAGPPLARVDSVNFIVGRRSGFLPPIVAGVFKRV